MISVISKETMRALDAHMIHDMHIPSIVLMENAAFGMTTVISEQFAANTPVVVVCGTGNNGGDGFAAARQLRTKGFDVRVYLIGKQENLKGDAAANAAFFADDITEIADNEQAKAHLSDLRGCVAIDAIFGIGLSREAGGLFACVIDTLNNCGAYIVTCDIPSGIDANTGNVLGAAIRANETVTFQCAKPGLLLYPGREYTGRLTVKEIGISGNFDIGRMYLADCITLPHRCANAHKGMYGRLSCVVSSQGMAGAGLMCVGGALRAGAGLTTAGVPTALHSIFNARYPECMTYSLNPDSSLDELMAGKSALAAGCGLTTSNDASKTIAQLVTNYDIRKVFDADALNIIAQDNSLLQRKCGDIVLTPHLGEFSRLCGLSIDEINQDALETAQRFAAKFEVTVLLKGATTIVTDGKRTVLITAGSPGMAKGGSGDVLTGVIGGLLAAADANGMDVFDCAAAGAYICGKAGEAAASSIGEHSMTAVDTLDHIGSVMKAMTV